jgi:hypothetical protein
VEDHWSRFINDREAFSRILLVPIAETGINGLYKPGLKAFFSTSACSRSIPSNSAVRASTCFHQNIKLIFRAAKIDWSIVFHPANEYKNPAGDGAHVYFFSPMDLPPSDQHCRPPGTTMDSDTWKSCGATGYIVNDAGVMVGLKTTLVLYAKG